MNYPSLTERYDRLINWAHSRTESPLTPEQVSERSGVAIAAINAVRSGRGAFTEDEARAAGRALGLTDPVYLFAELTADDLPRVVAMHERLAMFIEARELGVEHIAARGACDEAAVIQRVRSHIASLKQPS